MNNISRPILLLAFYSLTVSPQILADNSVVAEEDLSTPSSVELIMQQPIKQSTKQSMQQTGDVVILPAKEIQPGETVKIKIIDSPRRGMSMDKVRNELGPPISTTDSVGQPPITTWIYLDRVVFFEYSTVIHVVSK